MSGTVPSERREGTLFVEEVDVGWQVTTDGFSTTAPALSEALAAFNDWLREQGSTWKVWRDERLAPGTLRWFVVRRERNDPGHPPSSPHAPGESRPDKERLTAR